MAVAGSYPLATARSKVAAVTAMARAKEFPLRCSFEGEKDVVRVRFLNLEKRRNDLPAGWIMAGSDPEDYDIGIDTKVFHSGTRCSFMKHAIEAPRGFGTLMQMFSADEFHKKRLRMRMWVKTQDVVGRVQSWLRVDGPKRTNMLAFDNFCKKQIEGTTDWQLTESVLDVAESATNIAFGIILAGVGKVWIDDISFEAVGTDVPTTDCPCGGTKRKNKTNPRNLDFEDE